MKKLLLLLFVITVSTSNAFAQEQETPKDSIAISAIAEEERHAVIAKVEDAEKQAKKEKKQAQKDKKAEKKKVAEEKLKKSIASKRKDIAKDTKQIAKLKSKLDKGSAQGKLSPVDMEKLKEKINKLNIKTAKNKDKLTKLLKK